MEYWFAVDIDRCHITGMYGMGVRLYSNKINSPTGFLIIDRYSTRDNKIYVYSKPDSICENTESIELVGEPNNELFNKSILKSWEEWDKIHGEMMEEDRPDYKPIAYQNVNELLNQLKSVS
jgi:hypothetical protein